MCKLFNLEIKIVAKNKIGLANLLSKILSELLLTDKSEDNYCLDDNHYRFKIKKEKIDTI